MYYILDRNYIIEMEKFVSGEKHDAEIIEKAKRIDVKGNCVSGVTSILEGSNFSSEGEIVRGDIARESRIIGEFFRNARTDSAFFENNILEASLALQDHKSNEVQVELDSFAKIRKFLGRENSKECSWSKFNELIEFKNNNEYVWGMAFVAATASIFGHQGARDVLKLNKTSSRQLEYNSYSDLKLISIIPNLEHKFYKLSGGRLIKFILKSNDKGLVDFRGSFKFNKIESKETIYGSELKLSLDLKKFTNDLPFASEKRKKDIISILESS